MADENKIVTPSDIEEAKTETVDTQTTATVENTVAEKDEKVESVVTDEEIAKIISRWTGIPVAKLTETERNKTLHLDEQLHKRVICLQNSFRFPTGPSWR